MTEGEAKYVKGLILEIKTLQGQVTYLQSQIENSRKHLEIVIEAERTLHRQVQERQEIIEKLNRELSIEKKVVRQTYVEK